MMKTPRSDMFTVTLPWPPSLNHYWRTATVRRKNAAVLASQGFHATQAVTYLSKSGRDYRQAAVAMIRNAMWDTRRPYPLKGRLCATIALYPPDRRVRDSDNLVKAMFDALTYAGLWADDCQAKRWSVEMYDDETDERVSGGKVVITVVSLTPDA